MSAPDAIESSSDSAIGQLLASLHKSTSDKSSLKDPASEQHSNNPTRPGTPEFGPEIIIIPTHTSLTQSEAAEENNVSTAEDFEFVQPPPSQPEASTQPLSVPKKGKKAKRKESKKEKKNKKAEEPLDEDLVVEEPVVETSLAKDTVIEESLTIEPPVFKEPIFQVPIIEESLTIEPPVFKEPIFQVPIIEEPVVEEAATEQPVIEEPIIEAVVTEEPFSKERIDLESSPEHVQGITETEQRESSLGEESHIDNSSRFHETEESELHQHADIPSSYSSLENSIIDVPAASHQPEQEIALVTAGPEEILRIEEEVCIDTEPDSFQLEHITAEQDGNSVVVEPEPASTESTRPEEEDTVLIQDVDPGVEAQELSNPEPVRGPDEGGQNIDSSISTQDLFENQLRSEGQGVLSNRQESSKSPELQQSADILEAGQSVCVILPETLQSGSGNTGVQNDNNLGVHTPIKEASEAFITEEISALDPTSQLDTDLTEGDRDTILENLTVSRPQSVAEIIGSINEKFVAEEVVQPEIDIQETSTIGETESDPAVVETSIPEPFVEPHSISAQTVTSTDLEQTPEVISRSPTLDLTIVELTPPAHLINPVQPAAVEFTQQANSSSYASTVEDNPDTVVTPAASIDSSEQIEEHTREPTIEPTKEPINTPNMALQDRSLIASQLSDALALFNSFDASVKSLVDSLQSNSRPPITKHEEQNSSSSASVSAVFQVPHPRNTKFHGRFSLLSRMLGMWRPQQRCRIAVAGLGGFGKTELVTEFVHRAREVSPNTPVFWFSPDDIRSKESPSSAMAGTQLEDWLRGQQAHDSILVVDSGDKSDLFESSSDRGSFIDHLQNFQGTVILVSRNGRDCNLVARPHEVCEVRELELDACLKMMYDHLEVYARDASTQWEMQQVIKLLGLHPRAIIQATKVINSMQMTVSQFHEMYSTSEAFQLRLFSRIDPYSKPDHASVIDRGIFDVRNFRKSYTDQSRLIYQIYYLGGKLVPSSMVTTNDPLDKIILMLLVKAHFMINEDVFNDTLSIHPMVYLAMRKALSSERSLSDETEMLEERKWHAEAFLAFAKHYPDANNENRVWWNDCFAHLINGYTQHSDTIKLATATIYHKESAYFKRKGLFFEALKTATMARNSLPSPVPSEGLVILQGQITLLDFLAKYREVHELLRGLAMEAGHPGNLWKKSMLAKLEIADCANRYDSAIDVFRQIRTAGEAANVDTLDLANATDDLSMALMHKGKHGEAAAECRKALAVRSSRLGSSHTDTLSSCHHLAEVLYRDGKFEEAARYVQEALRGRESALGADHPETLYSQVLMTRISISRANTTAEFDDAEFILNNAAEKLGASLSLSHPIVMTCKSEIARIMFARGQYEMAETMNQTVLSMRERGPWLEPNTHPDTMTSRNQLAEVIRLNNGCKAADNLSERCLTERTVVLTNGSLTNDDFHPDQLSSLHNRAVILSGLGQHLAALQKIDLAVLGRKAILGERHPDYFVSMTWKGEIMRAQLHRYQSERTQTLDTIDNLHKTAYEGLVWIFGSEHYLSLQCATHMALAMRERGSPSSSEAEGVFRQIHCAYQHNMGDFHPETLKSKGRLAEAMRAASPRHHGEAKKLWRDSCGGLTRIYGFDAYVTANAYKGYEKFLKTYPDP